MNCPFFSFLLHFFKDHYPSLILSASYLSPPSLLFSLALQNQFTSLFSADNYSSHSFKKTKDISDKICSLASSKLHLFLGPSFLPSLLLRRSMFERGRGQSPGAATFSRTIIYLLFAASLTYLETCPRFCAPASAFLYGHCPSPPMSPPH